MDDPHLDELYRQLKAINDAAESFVEDSWTRNQYEEAACGVSSEIDEYQEQEEQTRPQLWKKMP